ncbi:uncharacterized protein FOMMEDRAFT_150941 [Fomitiporia mediterranea MF3/22]|uniref:uncharacterized protein n=1 Tax=Fomitiporia mediterranea (strain MF3/22) TaxID=694068 RepID=UPI0004408EB2|nr:uncharacterized protein FOMMEDRAFT_150941 [Fomitiporia mediterranea MF3/22]EJD08218.1 hypothetical protein FOMMEDRAFT_150941 [Fomitiporia mediterranea MF3/22]
MFNSITSCHPSRPKSVELQAARYVDSGLAAVDRERSYNSWSFIELDVALSFAVPAETNWARPLEADASGLCNVFVSISSGPMVHYEDTEDVKRESRLTMDGVSSLGRFLAGLAGICPRVQIEIIYHLGDCLASGKNMTYLAVLSCFLQHRFGTNSSSGENLSETKHALAKDLLYVTAMLSRTDKAELSDALR